MGEEEGYIQTKDENSKVNYQYIVEVSWFTIRILLTFLNNSSVICAFSLDNLPIYQIFNPHFVRRKNKWPPNFSRLWAEFRPPSLFRQDCLEFQRHVVSWQIKCSCLEKSMVGKFGVELWYFVTKIILTYCEKKLF